MVEQQTQLAQTQPRKLVQVQLLSGRPRFWGNGVIGSTVRKRILTRMYSAANFIPRQGTGPWFEPRLPHQNYGVVMEIKEIEKLTIHEGETLVVTVDLGNLPTPIAKKRIEDLQVYVKSVVKCPVMIVDSRVKISKVAVEDDIVS